MLLREIRRQRRYASRERQRGVVIVVALFIVALVATMSYFMMSRLARDTERTSLVLRNTQADFYAQGSIAWAIEQLRDNLAKQQPNKLVDTMPIRSPVNEVNGYKISSTITDMQARYNLNNLINADAQVSFKRLLLLLDSQLTPEKAQALVLAVADWVTPVQQENEYNRYYLALPLPYRAAHKPMASVSELLLVKGMTPDLYQRLLPYICALPVPTLINARTAMAPVLAALSETMSLEAGKAAQKARDDMTMHSIEDFLNLDIVKNNHIPADKVTAVSNYFLVETTVNIEKQQVLLYTLLERTGADAGGTVRTIWQSKSVPG